MPTITGEQFWGDIPSFSKEELRIGIPEIIKSEIDALRSIYITLILCLNELHLATIFLEKKESLPEGALHDYFSLTIFSRSKSIAISLVSVFDNDGIDLRKSINASLRLSDEEIEACEDAYLIKKIQREIRAEKANHKEKGVNKSLENLISFRNQDIAHTDMNPKCEIYLPSYGEINDIILYAINMTNLCIKISTTREMNLDKILSTSRMKSDVFEKFLTSLRA